MNLLHIALVVFALQLVEVPASVVRSPIACSSNDGPFCPVINGLEKRAHRESRKNEGETFLEKVESILENIFGKGDIFSNVQDVSNALENDDFQIDLSDDDIGEDYNAEDIQLLLKRLGIKGSHDEMFSKDGKVKVKVVRIGRKNKPSDKEEVTASPTPENDQSDESELQEEDGALVSDDSDDLEGNDDVSSADGEGDINYSADDAADEGDSEFTDLLDSSTEQVAAALDDAFENPDSYQEELRNQFYELTKDNTDEENEAVLDYYRVAIEGITGGDEDIRKSLENQLRDLLSGGGRREKRSKEAADSKKISETKPVKKTEQFGKTTVDPITGTVRYSNVERIANTPRGRNRRAKIVIKRTENYPDPISKFKPHLSNLGSKSSQSSFQQATVMKEVENVEKRLSRKEQTQVSENLVPSNVVPKELPKESSQHRGNLLPNNVVSKDNSQHKEKSKDDTKERTHGYDHRKSNSRLQAS